MDATLSPAVGVQLPSTERFPYAHVEQAGPLQTLSYSQHATGALPLPPVPQAPSYHEHTHDVHLLQTWIETAGQEDPLTIKKADVVAEGLIDYIMSRSKQHNEFFTELVRQTRVHCPKVATYVTPSSGCGVGFSFGFRVGLQIVDSHLEWNVQLTGPCHGQL